MDFVYSQSPWVLPKDPEGTEKIFSDHGWKVTFNDHEVIPFGLEKRVYFIRKGLFATLAGGAGDFSRMVGLFPAGTTLGAIRAISQPGNEMPLMAKLCCLSRLWRSTFRYISESLKKILRFSLSPKRISF